VIEVPTIAIEPIGGAIPGLGDVDWVVFTSQNAVTQVRDRVRDTRAFGTSRVAAVGPGTAAALASFGVVADLVAARSVGEGLVDAFPAHSGPAGTGRVLLPQAEGARPVVAEGLRAKGWTVEVVTTYRSVAVDPGPDGRDAIRTADAVTFTSASTVSALVAAIGVEAVPAVIVCIGDVTARAAADLGLTVTAVAETPTLEALVAAVITAFVGRTTRGDDR
jgi:uroporphyrinogen-III synthase